MCLKPSVSYVFDLDVVFKRAIVIRKGDIGDLSCTSAFNSCSRLSSSQVLNSSAFSHDVYVNGKQAIVKAMKNFSHFVKAIGMHAIILICLKSVERERDRQTQTETETERQRDRDIETETETERQRQRDSQRERRRRRVRHFTDIAWIDCCKEINSFHSNPTEKRRLMDAVFRAER